MSYGSISTMGVDAEWSGAPILRRRPLVIAGAVSLLAIFATVGLLSTARAPAAILLAHPQAKLSKAHLEKLAAVCPCAAVQSLTASDCPCAEVRPPQQPCTSFLHGPANRYAATMER